MKKLIEASILLVLLLSLIYCGFIHGQNIESDSSDMAYDTEIDQENDVSVVGKDQLEHTDSLESSSEETLTEEPITEEEITESSSEIESTESESSESEFTEDESTENESKDQQSTEESSKEESFTENILIGENIISEDKIYSFFQRSEAWYQGVPWSGEWSILEYKGKVFSDFGCGLCCMANVYDTLSPYEVSPKDMFNRAMNVSSYAPSSSGAAISWWNMRTTLKNCGIICNLYNKPSSYGTFQQQMSQCTTAVVLVSSAYDNTYWTTTKGHYVTIWNYDKDTDTVFLADPGKISRNRERIPLRYVYNALKLSSDYQFLAITEYVEENNQWKGNGIKDQWVRPLRRNCNE
jgi:hypothetical protein